MCEAFSGLVKESGEVIWKFGVDSHEDLIEKAGLKDDTDRKDQMTFARFEISPDNGSYLAPDKWTFKLDQPTMPTWWSGVHEAEAWKAKDAWQKKLDKILVHKDIVHPFKDIAPPKKITKKHLDLLKQWASVRASVEASVEASVRASVEASVEASVWASVWASVGASVEASVWASVWASVGASVGALVGSFFNLPRSKWKYTENIRTKNYPFRPAVDLWMMGLVPSFNGKLWRLHGGKDAKVLWEGEIEGRK